MRKGLSLWNQVRCILASISSVFAGFFSPSIGLEASKDAETRQIVYGPWSFEQGFEFWGALQDDSSLRLLDSRYQDLQLP